MTHINFVDRHFELLGRVEPERDDKGAFVEFLPQDRYEKATTTQLHKYGAGPFCRFRIGRGRKDAGLYVLTVDGNAWQSASIEN